MVEAGAPSGFRSPGLGSHRVRPRMLPQNRRRRSSRWSPLAERPSASTHRRPIDKELYDQISAQSRAELKDALDTKKYPKLESYAKVAELEEANG